jgi:hypothetical protein
VKVAQALFRNSYEDSPFIRLRSLSKATALPRADPTSRATFDRTFSGSTDENARRSEKPVPLPPFRVRCAHRSAKRTFVRAGRTGADT